MKSKLKKLTRTLLASAWAITTPQVYATSYTLTTIDNPSTQVLNPSSIPSVQFTYLDMNSSYFYSGGTIVNGINDSGLLIGNFTDGSDSRGFLYNGNQYKTLTEPSSIVPQNIDLPHKHKTFFKAINNDNQIVGTIEYSETYISFSFVSTDNDFYDRVQSPIEPLGTVVEDINNYGVIVGFVRRVLDRFSHGADDQGYIFKGNTYTSIDPGIAYPYMSYNIAQLYAINDNGKTLGFYDYTNGITITYMSAFIYDGTNYIDITQPQIYGQYAGINNNEQAVGNFYDSAASHGWFYDGNSFKIFDFPDATKTTLTDINNNGQIVGFYTDNAGKYHGFVATPDDTGIVTSPCPPSAIYNFWTRELILQDVEVEGIHYWAKLKDQGGYKFLLMDSHAVNAGICTDSLLAHYQDNTLTIPMVAAFGANYRITLEQSGVQMLFELNSAILQ